MMNWKSADVQSNNSKKKNIYKKNGIRSTFINKNNFSNHAITLEKLLTEKGESTVRHLENQPVSEPFQSY